MFKPRPYKSLLVGFFLVLFAIRSALAGNITMIYWGAYDVEESIQWQQFYEAQVAEDMQQRGIVFLDACKDYFGEDLELGNEEPIRDSSAFQVTYCDGVMPVWSGLPSSYPCGPGKKILLSNEMNAGGARMAGENIASSCPI